MTQGKREEAANVALGKSLGELLGKSFEVQAELIWKQDKKLLDISIRKNGVHIVLEAKHNNFKAAVAAAKKRWDEITPAPDIVGAVSYSPPFRNSYEDAVRQGATVDFALSGDKFQDLAAQKQTGEVYDLAQMLRRPYSIIKPGEDDIDKAIARIDGVITLFADCNHNNRGKLMRWAELLQANFNGENEKEVLHQSAKMAGLIIFGAVLFQMELAAKNNDVKEPRKIFDEGRVVALRDHWSYILDEINYAAIFSIAREITIVGNVLSKEMKMFIDAANEVRDVARDGVDILGRMYHELLADAKPLGAFYTTIPAATMMAALALNPEDWKGTDWTDANSVGKLRIADPACGSGTLLAAAAWQLLDNFSREHFKEYGGRFGGKKKEHPQTHLQRLLIEEIVWGYDILETAAHLSAAALGMMSPETDFKKAHIYRSIIGDTQTGTAAGSLELLEGNMPIFRRDKQIETGHTEPLPPLDACIMNPPFVRGQKGHESFSFLPEQEQENVHKRMRELGKKYNFTGDKGQGAGFMTLACLKRTDTSFVREGGKIAVILPIAAAVGMGKAWGGVRKKIEKDFNLEVVMVSREHGRSNFSENTALQECIMVARRRKKNEKPNKKAMFVVLRKNPETVNEAQATAKSILREKRKGLPLGNLESENSVFYRTSTNNIGQYAMLPWHGSSAWRGLSFANIQLAFAAESFSETGTLAPFVKVGKIKLARLGDIASVGSCRLHLYLSGAKTEEPHARLSKTETEYAGYYPGFHKRESGVFQKDLRQISESPQCYWLPMPGHETWADKFSEKGGRVLLVESMGLQAMRRLAVLMPKPVQASHYWPIKLHNETEDKLKTLTLWLNSTPALLLIANSVQSTHGAKVCFSQTAVKEMPVLNLDLLAPDRLRQAAAMFDEIAKGPGLEPLPKMEFDEERLKIDMLFSDIFALGNLSPLRGALAIEPIITGKEVLAAE